MQLVPTGSDTGPHYRHLPTVDRYVLEENRHAILMRWRLANSKEILDPRQQTRWFPQQRDLFDILSVITQEQALEMADCSVPLFQIRLPVVANIEAFQCAMPANQMELACMEESFMALITRLDALRRSYQQACCVFDLSAPRANFIAKHSPRELKSISCDPSVTLIPTPSDKYFTVAAMQQMKPKERSVLAATTRRVANVSH